MNITDLVGERVIVRCNEDEPSQLGTLTGWHAMHGREMPLVKFDTDGKERVCFSLVLPYTEELWKFIGGLPNKRAWEIFANISVANQIRTRKAFG